MKKFTKFIYFILAFALITCMSIFNPVIDSVYAKTEVSNDDAISISSSRVPNTITKTEDFKIPMPDVTGVDVTSPKVKRIVEVTDKSGTKFEYVVGDNITDSNKYFTLVDNSGAEVTTYAEGVTVRPAKLARGTYVVRYKVVDSTDAENVKTYYSSAQYVKVEGVTYSWQMEEENTTKNIIPSVVAAGTSIVLPLPKIMDSKDNVAYDFGVKANAQASIQITKNGNKLTANTDAEFSIADDGTVTFTPTLYNNETTTYIIRYKSSQSSLADKKFTVKVEPGYSNLATLEVTHSSISNPQVGAVTTFPTANVTDKTHNKTDVEVNTTIVIKDRDGVEKIRLEPNQFKYTFTETATKYYVYYEVEDAYGNKAVSKGDEISITDRAPYVIDYAKDYDTSAADWEDKVVTGASYLIPSEIGYGGFYLPAVYAKDYKNAYGDLEFKRELILKTDSDVTYNIDKAEDNGALTTDNTDYTKAIKFEFPDDTAEEIKKHAGQVFKVRYSATDKSGNTAYTTIYEIKIAEDEILPNNVDKGLKIDFPTITTRIDSSEEFTFKAATAKEKPENEEDVADARLEVRTFYYYGNASKFEAILAEYRKGFTSDDYHQKYAYKFDDFLAKLNSGYTTPAITGVATTELNGKDGKITFSLEDYDSARDGNVVTIFAVAMNDQGQFVYKTQEVEIKNTIEFKAPTIVADSIVEYYDEQLDTRSKFDQNETVILPSIKFTDTNDDYLEVDAECYVQLADGAIKNLDVKIVDFLQNGIAEKTAEGHGAEVDAIYAGTYYITYTATDDAGNKVTYFSTFKVANTAKAHIQVENGQNISIKTGEEVKFALGLVGGDIDAGTEDYTITWAGQTPSSGSDKHAYRFKKAGTYTATITATYKINGKLYNAEPSVTVTINVTNPTIVWDSNVDDLLQDTIADDDGEKIILADVLAGDAVVTRKVTHTDDDGKVTDVTLLQDEDTLEWYFNANKNGVYKVTFIATNEYGETDEKSYSITCGDYYEPIITIANNKLQDSNITYNNENITFKATWEQKKDDENEAIDGEYILKVVATEGDKEVFNYDIAVHLDDQDKDNAIVALNDITPTFSFSGGSYSSNGSNSWTIKGVGTYTLKMTVKDANGNSTTKSISFNVSSKVEPTEKKDNVAGIVLIVVSAVILCGVILFFALAGKRKPKKRVSIKTEEAKKD